VFITAGNPRRKACSEIEEFRGPGRGAIHLAILMPLDDAIVVLLVR